MVGIALRGVPGRAGEGVQARYPLKDRDDWEALLRERTAEIGRLTNEIVRLETELNEAVYEAFGLDDKERALIEQETKYRFGDGNALPNVV